MNYSDCETQGKRRRSNNNKQEEDEDEAGGASGLMENLPREVNLDIISRLLISSLVQSKYVCRAWSMLAQDLNLIDLRNYHAARNNIIDPCLIFHSNYPIRNQLYFLDFPSRYDDSSRKETVKKIQTPFCASMPQFEVVGSCNGLLCLSDSLHNDSLYIYNPFTRDYRELPKYILRMKQEKAMVGFGFHSETKEYKVVKINYYWKDYHGVPPNGYTSSVQQSDFQILTLGSSTWTSVEKPYHFFCQRLEQVLVNGRFHWLTWCPSNTLVIISFDLADEQFKVVQEPDDEGLRNTYYHRAVLRGCLAAAFHCRNGKSEIWVMKEYDVKESWVKEFDIPNHLPK